jgi:hypothetical protein
LNWQGQTNQINIGGGIHREALLIITLALL